MIGRENEIRHYRDRVGLFTVIMIGAMLILIGRLFYLQILKGDDLRRFGESNRLKKERLAPTRGVIYDRQGRVIVDNRAAFDVILLSQYYPFTPEVDARLAKAIQMAPAELEKRLSKARKSKTFHPVLLKADVSKDVVAAITMDAEGFPGIDIEATVQRRYPYGELAAQLLGYIGEVDNSDLRSDPTLQLGDTIGKMGLERTFDSSLRGVNGIGYVEVDARGRRRLTQEGQRLLGYVTREDPKPGDNLHLTIDMDLEAAAAASMESRKFYGSVVAMDPRSGDILALINSPAYHPGKISGREVDSEIWRALSSSEHRPLRNRAIQDHYPPGSTFKLLLSLAALKEGIATKNTTVNCRGGMQFGTRRFNCWKTHGPVDFVGAIRESCDVFFYQVGIQLGVDRIAHYARLFGFGSRTGIGVTGEQKGLIPDSEWKLKRFNEPWQPGETLSVSIGQGYVDVTPLQLVAAYAAIGNEGFLYKPHLIRRIEKTSGELVREFKPELVRKIDLDASVFGPVKEGLFEVVNSMRGTGIRSKSLKTTLSGKTGTSQVRAFTNIMSKKCENLEYRDRHHGLFVGYAPRENPEIAVVAIAEHSCHGSLAGPVVKDVVEAYFDKQASLVAGPLAPATGAETGSASADPAAAMRAVKPVSTSEEAGRRVATPAVPTQVDETREE